MKKSIPEVLKANLVTFNTGNQVIYSVTDYNQLVRCLEEYHESNNDAVEFAKWLQHLDNGTEHYNPYTKETTESIGFAPQECLDNGIKTVEELYELFKKQTK